MLPIGGCRQPRSEDLLGTYKFDSADVHETVKLESGGKYFQHIVLDGVAFETSGEWVMDQYPQVKLRNFWVRYDTNKKRLLDQPQKYGAYFGFYNQNERRLEFDDANEYWLKREAK